MATLPQFSRNYGSRGGAYERPTTVVETPSNNPWAKAIETMGRITAEQIAKRSKNNSLAVQQTQKYLDENAQFLLDSYDEFSDNMEEVGVNNPSLNKVGLFAIEKKANAYMGMKSARSREEQAAFAKEYAFWDGKINELNITVQAGKDADADYTTDYLDGYAKVNMPNGISTVNMNEGLSKQYQLAMPARTGTTRNPKEQWFFDQDDNWKLKLMYTSDQITNAFERGEIDNNYIVADPKVLFAFDGGKIDDLASARNKFLVESGIIDENTKKYTDDYVLGVEQGTTKDGKYNYQFRPRNTDKIKGTTSVFINAQTRSYAKYPAQAMNLWNTTLGQGANIDPAIVKNLEKQFGIKYRQDETGGYKLDMAFGDTGTAFNPESVALLEAAIADFVYSDLRDGNDSNYTLAKTDGDGDKPVDVSYIDEIKIDAKGTGPTEEGRPLFNLSEVEVQLAPYGFRVGDKELIVAGRQGRTLTKSTPGGDRSVNVFENLTEDKLRDLLKFIDTGDNKYLQDIQAEPVDYKGIDLLTMPGQ